MSQNTKNNTASSIITAMFRKQIFIPLAALLILALFNFIMDPSFFKITLGHNSNGDRSSRATLFPLSITALSSRYSLWA